MVRKIFVLLCLLVVLALTLQPVSFADGGYTLRQYICDYYAEVYGESDVSFERITVTDTERQDELWQLPGEFFDNELFLSEIDKVDEPFVIQTQKRYYVTLQSAGGNLFYLGITGGGEVFFGRYADSDKPNYCEYRVKDTGKLLDTLLSVCAAGAEGYISQKPVVYVPKCSEWAVSAVTRGAELSFIPDYLLSRDFFENASRIEFCRMAYRMLNEKQQAEPNQYQHPFADVDKDEKDLAYLYEKGIINGKSAETFSPDDSISREEAAAILDRLFAFICEPDAAEKSDKLYSDDGVISDWAKKSVYSMKARGIMVGVSDEIFAPHELFSLEQTVITLVRIYEYN